MRREEFSDTFGFGPEPVIAYQAWNDLIGVKLANEALCSENYIPFMPMVHMQSTITGVRSEIQWCSPCTTKSASEYSASRQ